MSTIEKIGTIGETRTLKCSNRTGTLYLYLPKALVDLYGLLGGDMVKVKLGEIYRQKMKGKTEKETD